MGYEIFPQINTWVFSSYAGYLSKLDFELQKDTSKYYIVNNNQKKDKVTYNLLRERERELLSYKKEFEWDKKVVKQFISKLCVRNPLYRDTLLQIPRRFLPDYVVANSFLPEVDNSNNLGMEESIVKILDKYLGLKIVLAQ